MPEVFQQPRVFSFASFTALRFNNAMTRKLPRHLTWLEAFTAAVETGSLEGAAQHLGVARSVVSEHLKALEESLGGDEPLLERAAGKRLRLTPRGERLYEAAEGPLHQLNLRRLRDLASPEPGLRLGLNPTLSDFLLAPLAVELASKNIKLEVSFGGAFDLVRQVQTHQLDLALGFTPLPPHRGVENRTLLRLPFVVLAAPDAPLPKKAKLRVADLVGSPFVDWLRDDPYGGANSARFAAAGIQAKEAARVESFLHLFAVLRAYKGCAIAPDLRRLGAFPKDLRVTPLVEPEPQAVEIVALLPSDGASPAAELALTRLARHLKARR